MTTHNIGFDTILQDISGASKGDLKYPTLEDEKELVRREQEITVDGEFKVVIFWGKKVR